MMRILFICVFFVFTEVFSQSENCYEAHTCAQCMEKGRKCSWCKQWNFDPKAYRCDTSNNLLLQNCSSIEIVNPIANLTYDKILQPRNAEAGLDAVQLSPQNITIQLRPNQPFTFPIHFRQAENFPVDLYYIMDLSQSMADDKEKVAKLGVEIAKSLKKITSNFRLGFGTFVDKKVMPYVSMIPAALRSPCDGCASPYGFKNQLVLTDDAKQFRKKVQDAPNSGNLDSPEGGFDALMQAIVCGQQIGWRGNSRKLIIFSTDAAFHYAGDGKLGGIVDPNDGLCHLDQNGNYNMSEHQDYPSIGQISAKVAENKVNVIFAVIKDQVNVYRQLSKVIEGSGVGELANDSSNIVHLIKDNYEKISSTLKLKTQNADDIEISFKSKCNGTKLEETDKCENLGIGENVTFLATLSIGRCPKFREDFKKTFSIGLVGLTEQLTINLDMICQCDCESTALSVVNSDRCSNQGTYQCGACTCNKNRFGKICQCDTTNSSLTSKNSDNQCKMFNTSSVCEGRGQCACGTCDCNVINDADPTKRYSGDYCQCDDYSCDRYNRQLCGGPERGNCNCGTCLCLSGYNGTACECLQSDMTCMASNGIMCNGKGGCHCGRCECSLDTYYKGPTCEDCTTCPGRCETSKPCVLCRAFHSGPLGEEDCRVNCSHVRLDDSIEESEDLRSCTGRDENDCIYRFAYEYESDLVYARRTKECPTPINLWAIILGVIFAILLIGLLLLLIWKIYATIHDKREVAEFEKERMKAKWDTGENPIYKKATSTFNNPTYAGK